MKILNNIATEYTEFTERGFINLFNINSVPSVRSVAKRFIRRIRTIGVILKDSPSYTFLRKGLISALKKGEL